MREEISLEVRVPLGDVIATGINNRGLSALQDGDLIELETEGLGRLHITAVGLNLPLLYLKGNHVQL